MVYKYIRNFLFILTPNVDIYKDGMFIARLDRRAFKIKEKMTVYKDKEKQQPLFTLQAKNVQDVFAEYDLFDALGQHTAIIKSEWYYQPTSKNIGRYSYKVMDATGNEIGRYIFTKYIDYKTNKEQLDSIFRGTAKIMQGDRSIGRFYTPFRESLKRLFILQLVTEVGYDDETLSEEVRIAVPAIRLAVMNTRN